MRVVQPEGTRGSLKWIQRLVNFRPDLLKGAGFADIRWLSPLISDDYAEYRDRSFLELIGHAKLASDLAVFWPDRGPQWDALGKAGDTVFLVEAKAHIQEFLSPPSAAKGESKERINAALVHVQTELSGKNDPKWGPNFYQYVNRIAHLHFLRSRGVDAHLILVSFVNDQEIGKPATIAEWQVAYQCADYALGLGVKHGLAKYIHHEFPDVVELN